MVFVSFVVATTFLFAVDKVEARLSIKILLDESFLLQKHAFLYIFTHISVFFVLFFGYGLIVSGSEFLGP